MVSEPKRIFVNLPVCDLARSIAFHTAVGGTQNKDFSNETAAMVTLSDTIALMLLTHERFAGFTTRKIVDAAVSAQVLLALSTESREAVDALVAAAAAAGGEPDPNPVQEHGFMYGRSYADPDGHIFEVFWMDVEAAVDSRSEPAA